MSAMTFPGFTAESSVYKTENKYRLSAGGTEMTGRIEPAVSRRSCAKWCCDDNGCDDGCLECCWCLAGGGHPNQCCF